jgi:hypothetical protein
MYSKVGPASGLGTFAALPFTGFNIVWYCLAAFALFACGMALLRSLPRKES